MADNKLIDFLRSLKVTYSAYNMLHGESLEHNRGPYKDAGVKKFLFSSISSKDFAGLEPGDIPWMDKTVSEEEIHTKLHAADFSPSVKEAILHWKENGYLILEKFINEKAVEAINTEIENLLEKKEIEFSLGNKIMFANKKSELIRELSTREDIISVLNFVLGRKVVPFQTINFMTGSEQHAHSDSIHMTTYPLGYLIAIWVALEDISADAGPLSYYPGSHKLPYVLNDGYERGGNVFTVGADSNYLKYEHKIGQIVQEKKLPKKIFTAKKGDVLVWHANLIHGGEPIARPGATRKSMVIHYFAEDVIKYHEITERPALLQ
jgi:ectoine hydroxylase-related dioxygenase (phytanoyl-CoA dioxygenase family)